MNFFFSSLEPPGPGPPEDQKPRINFFFFSFFFFTSLLLDRCLSILEKSKPKLFRKASGGRWKESLGHTKGIFSLFSNASASIHVCKCKRDTAPEKFSFRKPVVGPFGPSKHVKGPRTRARRMPRSATGSLAHALSWVSWAGQAVSHSVC